MRNKKLEDMMAQVLGAVKEVADTVKKQDERLTKLEKDPLMVVHPNQTVIPEIASMVKSGEAVVSQPIISTKAEKEGKAVPFHRQPPPQAAPQPVHSVPQVIARIQSVQKSAADGMRPGPQLDATVEYFRKMEESGGQQFTTGKDAAIWNPRQPKNDPKIKPIGHSKDKE